MEERELALGRATARDAALPLLLLPPLLVHHLLDHQRRQPSAHPSQSMTTWLGGWGYSTLGDWVDTTTQLRYHEKRMMYLLFA